jgi:predicted Zn finger-like uncharacterized protein
MSLATSCPSCGTVFRVVQDQLKISEGWVRCGHCQEVFNALEGLFDLARRDSRSGTPDLATPATTNPTDPAWLETRPAMFSDGKVLRERQEALQNRTTPVGSPAPSPSPAPARKVPPATRVEISTRRAATWDPSVQEPERGMAPTQPDPGAWRTTSADAALPVLPPDLPDLDLLSAGDETAYPATTLEFRSEAFSAFAAARLQRNGRTDVDLPLEWPSAPMSLPPLPPDPDRRADPSAESPPASAPVVTTAATPASAPAPVEAAPASLAATPAPGTPPPPPLDDLEQTLDLSAGRTSSLASSQTMPAEEPRLPEAATAEEEPPPAPAAATDTAPSSPTAAHSEAAALPEFVRRADKQARWHRPIVRATLGLTALLLGSVLLTQASNHWHDLIAARWPATRPLLEQACAQWQCQLQPPRQLDALVVESTALSRPPGSDSYLLGVTLHNRASYTVAAPHIELSLTDLSGAVVVRRVLAPAEFRQPAMLVASGDASWTLEFTSTNPRIAGYTLAAFYP